jgi:hypothetical protein
VRLGQPRAAVDLLAGLSRGATTTWTADPPGHPGAEAVEVRARLLRSPPVAEAVAGLDAPSPA